MVSIAIHFQTLLNIKAADLHRCPIDDSPAFRRCIFVSSLADSSVQNRLTNYRVPYNDRWVVVSRVPRDYRMLRQRRPAWVLVLLYVLSQYVTAVSVLLEIVHVCAYPSPFAEVSSFADLLVRDNDTGVTESRRRVASK